MRKRRNVQQRKKCRTGKWQRIMRKTNHWRQSFQRDRAWRGRGKKPLAETRSLEIEWNGNPREDSSRRGQSSVHIGVFDNYYQSTRDIRDKDTCVCKCSLVTPGQGGRVIVRCQCVSGDPEVNPRCLSLFLFLSLAREFGYSRNWYWNRLSCEQRCSFLLVTYSWLCSSDADHSRAASQLFLPRVKFVLDEAQGSTKKRGTMRFQWIQCECERTRNDLRQTR